MTSDPRSRAEIVKTAARAVGFPLVGVASPDALQPAGERLLDWLDRDHHGEMSWMQETASLRCDPALVLPDCRAVVALALPYDTPFPRSVDVPASAEHAWISRHAWGDDYHDVVRGMLRNLEDELRRRLDAPCHMQSHVDTGPVLERAAATAAGLGWLGKNTCLIAGDRGSFVFLATLLIDLDLAADEPTEDRCGDCRACLDACPTGALVAPGRLDARRCRSYLSIEHPNELSDEQGRSLGRCVFGCDICQDVCPWNSRTPPSLSGAPAAFQPRDGLVHPRRDWLAGLWRGEFRRVFRRSTIRRRGRRRLQQTLSVLPPEAKP